MPFLEREGIQFHYEISGDGPPVVFCHGLTGNLEQPKELIQPLRGVSTHRLGCARTWQDESGRFTGRIHFRYLCQ